MDRRNFLGNLSWGSLALAGISSSGRATWKRPRFSAYPFSLGVASGDPLADGVVLWTRLAPDPLEGGGMPFVKFFNGQRGYVRCEVTPNLWQADYRVVEYVSRPGASIFTRASFVVEEGEAGVERA